MDALAVYIHWPYCARICPYCDFNVYKARPDDGLVGAICDDLAQWRDWVGPRRISAVHFGGGTPSLMSAQDIATIIKCIHTLWTIPDQTQIAIEANPGDAERRKYIDFAQAGINRLSLGVQSFQDVALALLGRDHGADESHLALETALSLFRSVSLDLIFGWAGQTIQDLQNDLDIATASGAHHISPYQLTIEDGTAFARAALRGQSRAVESDISADYYDAVTAHLKTHGYEHYEVSNFAKPDHRSRHNMAYWLGEDYVGVGPGAHGRATMNGQKFATVAALKPANYTPPPRDQAHIFSDKTLLSSQEQAEEYVLMGLRLREGISLTRYAEIAGQALSADKINPLIADNYLMRDNDYLSATETGWRVLNAVTRALIL